MIAEKIIWWEVGYLEKVQPEVYTSAARRPAASDGKGGNVKREGNQENE